MFPCLAMWWERIPSMGPPTPCLCFGRVFRHGFPLTSSRSFTMNKQGTRYYRGMVRACIYSWAWRHNDDFRKAKQVLHYLRENERPLYHNTSSSSQIWCAGKSLIWWEIIFIDRLSPIRVSLLIICALLIVFILKKKCFPAWLMWWERIPSMGPPTPCLCFGWVFCHGFSITFTLTTRSDSSIH